MDQLGSLSMIKLHNRSKVHAKVDKRVVLPTLLNSLLSLTLFFLLVGSVLAEGKTTKSHGFNFFGELNYSKDFPHLNYVNKDAPKGGEISIWSMGTFDSMNPYSRKGRAGALASAPFESLLEGTADEVGSLYGLLAETIEYPEDQTWVIFNLRDEAKFSDGTPVTAYDVKGALASAPFESLLEGTADEVGSLYGLLAETIEYPEDQTWVIFNLRDEAKFSDGTPVTAYDVKYTFELFLEQGLASYKAILGQIVQEAEVLGPKKIKYSFTPDASKRDAIPIVGGLPVMSKAWFDATGARLDESRMEIAIGSGPYVLDEFEVNKRISYKRNEDYWGNELPLMKGRSNFDTIKIEYFADTSAALEGFKSGEYTMRIENSSKNWATAYDFPALDEGKVIKKTLPDGGIASGQVLDHMFWTSSK